MKYKLRIYNFFTKKSYEYWTGDFDVILSEVNEWKDRGQTNISITLVQYDFHNDDNKENEKNE